MPISSESLRFDNKVVLVTGAGGGLGKEYALAFASRGASVVVNDLGGDIKGGGKNSKAADLVVQEIISNGGKAVPNYDSVEDGEKVVQTALDNFGKIDILVNNAGILRDRSFARTSDLDWDLIHRVHLRGSFLVTRAAWPHMKKNNYGRIIMTASAAGLYGNFGQANYSAAKLGLLGLSNTLAIEGAKYNIHCNTIAPVAGSRLTATVMPPDVLESLKAEYVAPFVQYLCHEDTEENGSVFEVGGGWAAKLRWQKSQGVILRTKGLPCTPENVRDNFNKVCDFANNPRYPTNIQAETMLAYDVIGDIQNKNFKAGTVKMAKTSAVSSSKPDPSLAIGYQPKPWQYTISQKDAILYALGVGASVGQDNYLDFLFELSDNFSIVPTFAVIPAQLCMMDVFTAQDMPVSIDPTQILHGEQYLELFQPLRTDIPLVSHSVISDVYDKGSGALFLVNVNTETENGERVAFNQFSIFVRGMGGYGGKRTSNVLKPTVEKPQRPPDSCIKEQTSINQAALYRLSGDSNPLHIDPNFAAMGGFSTPILHGLASYGYVVRHVLRQYCDNDVKRFRAIKARFSKPVFPGQVIQTEMWKEGSRIHVECKVVENGNICLSGAYVDIIENKNEDVEVEQEISLNDQLFHAIKERIDTSGADFVKRMNAVFVFEITKDKKPYRTWTVDLKNGNGDVYQGKPKIGKANVTLVMSDQDHLKLASGELSGQRAFLNGNVKVTGNIMLGMKLGQLFQEQAKL